MPELRLGKNERVLCMFPASIRSVSGQDPSADMMHRARFDVSRRSHEQRSALRERFTGCLVIVGQLRSRMSALVIRYYPFVYFLYMGTH